MPLWFGGWGALAGHTVAGGVITDREVIMLSERFQGVPGLGLDARAGTGGANMALLMAISAPSGTQKPMCQSTRPPPTGEGLLVGEDNRVSGRRREEEGRLGVVGEQQRKPARPRDPMSLTSFPVSVLPPSAIAPTSLLPMTC